MDSPVGLVTEMIQGGRFLSDYGISLECVYNLNKFEAKLPISEGPIDEETFLKYGIITAVHHSEAVQRYRSRHWFYRGPVQAFSESMEVV